MAEVTVRRGVRLVLGCCTVEVAFLRRMGCVDWAAMLKTWAEESGIGTFNNLGSSGGPRLTDSTDHRVVNYTLCPAF